MSVKMEINLTVILMFLTAMLFCDVQTNATTAQSVTPSPSPTNHEITPTNATTVSTDPHAAITKLFSDYTEWKLSVFPEYASEVGFHQFDAHLSDASVSGAARTAEECRRYKERAEEMLKTVHDKKSAHYLRLIQRQGQVCSDGEKYQGFLFAQVNYREGVQFSLPQL